MPTSKKVWFEFDSFDNLIEFKSTLKTHSYIITKDKLLSSYTSEEEIYTAIQNFGARVLNSNVVDSILNSIPY